MKHLAIYQLYPQVICIDGDIAYDENKKIVKYDAKLVSEKAIELKIQQENFVKAQESAKQSALNKLMALGLTEEEALALGVK